LLIGVAIALMLLDKADSVVIERARTLVTDATAPLLEAAARPVATFNEMRDRGSQLLSVAAENAALREQNERLQSWQTVARRLEAENKALRTMLSLAPDPAFRFVTARVIGDQGGAFVRSVLVNVGSRDGLAGGQAALTGQGLAGRVAEAGGHTSRVLLLTDMNSRIPILVGESRDRAMLAGDNTNQPRLIYLEPRVELKPGDRVVTSGHGGVFPPGLPIGQVASVGEDGIRVQPFVDWGHMEYLRLVDYELPGILRSPEGGVTPGNGR
jgi:rod shape-determining protein MreC